MSFRLQQHEADYRNSISTSLLLSVSFHLFLAVFGGIAVTALRLDERDPTTGYRGPTRTLAELEVLEPHSVQSYFYQRRREGRRQVPEYHLIQELDLEAGPEPIPVPQHEKTPEPHPPDFAEDLELIEPLKPVHKELSFSQDFVIIKAVKPDYPEYERTSLIEGQVVVAFYVTLAGEILEEQILESATDPKGASPRAFELAALEAVRQWEVVPPVRGGEPRGGWMKYRFVFDLLDVTP
ncbi:MAG: energy transducer TonB [Candidatus Krumholzibacteriia bacterium]